MKQSFTKEILKRKKLRFTKVRDEVLTIFRNKNYALSYYDIEKELQSEYDTATIYRTINTFVESDIIHQIPLDSKTAYYGINENGDPGSLKSDHIHFVCGNCRRTFCLDDVTVNNININSNFQLKSLKIIAEGICVGCSSK